MPTKMARELKTCRGDAKCTSFVEKDKVEPPCHLKLCDGYLQRRQNWTLCGSEGNGGHKQHQEKKFSLLIMKECLQNESGQTLEQFPQRDCGASIAGDF